MKEPERLLDGDRHPEAQTLLAAGRDDACLLYTSDAADE